MENNYKAIVTCDILKSRRYSNQKRAKLNKIIQDSFQECCELIPEANADRLSFGIIKGDEFQFIINVPGLAYKFVVYYRLILSQNILQPQFRSAIGIGDIAVKGKNTYKMDGEAFHFSRTGMDLFQNKENKKRLTFIHTADTLLNDELNMILLYQDFWENRWSLKSKESILLVLKYKTLQKAAEHTEVTYQALQKRNKNAHFKLFSKGFEYIRKKLTQPHRIVKALYCIKRIQPYRIVKYWEKLCF